MPPYSVEFFYKYIEIEMSAASVDEKKIIGGYEDALLHFAKHDLGITA